MSRVGRAEPRGAVRAARTPAARSSTRPGSPSPHKGFAGTTIRAVAAEAGVDPALVHHYFGTKDDLFLAALEIPVDPRALVPAVFDEGVDGAGERLLRLLPVGVGRPARPGCR